MEFEKQFCSLKSAKRLKELGVKQESMVHWIEYPFLMVYDEKIQKMECTETRTELNDGYWRPSEIINEWAAFTAAELGEILPHGTHVAYHKLKENEYRVRIKYRHKLVCERYANNEAEARALVLIYLLENNIELKRTDE